MSPLVPITNIRFLFSSLTSYYNAFIVWLASPQPSSSCYILYFFCLFGLILFCFALFALIYSFELFDFEFSIIWFISADSALYDNRLTIKCNHLTTICNHLTTNWPPLNLAWKCHDHQLQPFDNHLTIVDNHLTSIEQPLNRFWNAWNEIKLAYVQCNQSINIQATHQFIK